MRKALGKVEGGGCKYESTKQGEAPGRIKDGTDSTLIAVLLTGRGKTLLFAAAACLDESGTTLVVPYRRLINETVRNAKAIGIYYREWEHSIEDAADTVLVSANTQENGLNVPSLDFNRRQSQHRYTSQTFKQRLRLACGNIRLLETAKEPRGLKRYRTNSPS